MARYYRDDGLYDIRVTAPRTGKTWTDIWGSNLSKDGAKSRLNELSVGRYVVLEDGRKVKVYGDIDLEYEAVRID